MPRPRVPFMKVFISYRRDDSIIHARLIHNELAARFGADDVFMDIDDIDYGEDFAARIDENLDGADVVVAVIGPRWAELLQRRLHGDDYVRHELARALARGLRIVPVLVAKAPPPGDGLPPELDGLRRLNALLLDDRALKPHLNALVEAIQGRPFEQIADELSQRLRSQRRARWIGLGVGLAMFFAAWVALLDLAGLDTRLATVTMRLGQLGRDAPWSGQVVLVGIDERTVRAIGRPFDASWRREHAVLIERLAQAGARTMAFDLFFDRAGDPADDERLAAAVRASRLPVIVAARQTDGNQARLIAPLAATATAGIACAGQKFNQARSMPVLLERGDARLPSLALAAFAGGGGIEALDRRADSVRVRLPQEERSVDVHFSFVEAVRRPAASCEAIRAGDRVAMQLLDPAELPRLDAAPRRLAYESVLGVSDAGELAVVKGRIVLVGLLLPGQDQMDVPGHGRRFGAELIAQQIDAMTRGAVVRPTGAAGSFATMALAALAGAFAQRWAAPRAAAWRIGTAVLAGLACIAIVALAYREQRVLINLPYALAALALAWWAMHWTDKRSPR